MTSLPNAPSPRDRPARPGGEATSSQGRANDDASLLLAARGGGQRSWDLLIRRYDAAVKRVARRHRLSAADQEEVAQFTWLCLVEHIEALQEPAAVRGWLTTVARNESLRVLASSAREVPVDEPRHADAADATKVDEVVIEAARKRALHAALDDLPENQRKLLHTLLSEPGLNYDEVSARLDMPRGSIGPTRARGLARLRQDVRLAGAVDGHVDRRTPSRPGDDLI